MTKVIFSEIRNDPYLELWLKYYSKFFNGEDIYIANTNPSEPDEIINKAHKKYEFKVLKAPNPEWSMAISMGSVMEIQTKLLKSYDWVVFTHADEFIVPDPAVYKDLGDYIDKLDKDYVYCNGHDVLQMYEEEDKTPNEPPLDFAKPILKQRKYWFPTTSYSKPLISRIPLDWTEGFHKIKDLSDSSFVDVVDKDLYLCHMKCADYDTFGKRIYKRNIEKNYTWFYKNHNEKELIPERIRNSF